MKSRLGGEVAPSRSERGLVSVCIPTHNRGTHVGTAIRSALAQTYAPLEIIVVDDASGDDTVSQVRSFADPRVRLYVNQRRLGQNANRNRSVSLARGEFIKFLDDDDTLSPDCIAKLAGVFAVEPSLAFAFSRRRVIFDGLSAEAIDAWRGRYGEVHAGFSGLAAINDGMRLLRQVIAAGLRDNWIGEPTAVMVRRSSLEVAGTFGFHERNPDLGLWVRLLPLGRVGFVDEQLATYQQWRASESGRNASTGRMWTDRLWRLEGLSANPDIWRNVPELQHMLEEERWMAWRTVVRGGTVRGSRNVPVGAFLPYARFRAMARLGHRPATFGSLQPVAD